MHVNPRASLEIAPAILGNATGKPEPVDMIKVKADEIKTLKEDINKIDSKIKKETNATGVDTLKQKKTELKSELTQAKFELAEAKGEFTKTSVIKTLFDSLKKAFKDVFTPRKTTEWTKETDTTTKSTDQGAEKSKPIESAGSKEKTAQADVLFTKQAERPPSPAKAEPPKVKEEAKLEKPIMTEDKPIQPAKPEHLELAEKLFSKLASSNSTTKSEQPEISHAQPGRAGVQQDKQVNISNETKASPGEKLQELTNLIKKVETQLSSEKRSLEKKFLGTELKELKGLLTLHEKMLHLGNEMSELKSNVELHEDIAKNHPSDFINQQNLNAYKEKLEAKEQEFNHLMTSLDKSDLSKMGTVSPEKLAQAQKANQELKTHFNALNEEFKGEKTTKDVELLQRFLRLDNPLTRELSNLYLIPPEKRKDLWPSEQDMIQKGLNGMLKELNKNHPQVELEFMEGFQAFKEEVEVKEKEIKAAADLLEAKAKARLNQEIANNKEPILKYLSEIKEDLRDIADQNEFTEKAKKYPFINHFDLYNKDNPEIDMITDKAKFLRSFKTNEAAQAQAAKAAKLFDKY